MNYADPFERFRIGDGEGSWNADPAKRRELPGSQFPVEAYDNYMKQAVPRWLSTDKAVVDAYVALVDKVCPCVLLLHSQGGAFGFRVRSSGRTRSRRSSRSSRQPPATSARRRH